MKNNVYVLIMIAALSGCASSHLGTDSDFAFKEGGDTGLVVLATRMVDNEECYPLLHPKHAMMLSYELVNGASGTGLTRLNVRNPIIAKDYKNPDGFFHVHEAKAGTYQLSTIQYMSGSFLPIWLKGYTFKVYPNQVTYLGELTITETKCSESGGSEATLVFSDEGQRDEKLFHQRYPNVKNNLIYQKVTKGSVVTN